VTDEQVVPRVNLACRAMASKGAEILKPREWLWIPRAGRQDATDILNMVEQGALRHKQSFQVVVHLGPQPRKPKDRGYGSLSMLVMMYGKRTVTSMVLKHYDRMLKEQGFIQEQPRASLNKTGTKGDTDKRGDFVLIFTGGMWPRARRCRDKLVPMDFGNKGGLEGGDEYHCTWDCHKNKGSALEKSKDLKEEQGALRKKVQHSGPRRTEGGVMAEVGGHRVMHRSLLAAQTLQYNDKAKAWWSSRGAAAVP
jgi:hypothetical protein